jgi:hypothetical protein
LGIYQSDVPDAKKRELLNDMGTEAADTNYCDPGGAKLPLTVLAEEWHVSVEAIT